MLSISSDSGLGRPPADHSGQRLGAGRLEGQLSRFEGLLAHLGGTAELHPGAALVFAARLFVYTSHTPASVSEGVCVAYLSDGAWRGTVLHGTVSFR